MTATRREESLLEALSRVPDPRDRQGRWYELASGARSLYAIAQWGRQHRQLVCEALGIKRLTTPSHPQLHRIFAALEVQAFEAVLGKWLSTRGLKKGQGIAVDGKTDLAPKKWTHRYAALTVDSRSNSTGARYPRDECNRCRL